MTRNLDESVERDESLKSIYIETELKEKRQKKVKKLPEGVAVYTTEDGFRISTFYCFTDILTNKMERRFHQHKNLYLDLARFDPKRFGSKEQMPPKALDKLGKILPELDKGKLV